MAEDLPALLRAKDRRTRRQNPLDRPMLRITRYRGIPKADPRRVSRAGRVPPGKPQLNTNFSTAAGFAQKSQAHSCFGLVALDPATGIYWTRKNASARRGSTLINDSGITTFQGDSHFDAAACVHRTGGSPPMHPHRGSLLQPRKRAQWTSSTHTLTKPSPR